jgi:hypothetical protein
MRTSAYHPATNGSVERFHRSMNSMLAKCVSDNQRDWTTHLPTVMAAYRSAVHESTGYSPNFLHFGREVRAPIDAVFPHEQEPVTYDDYVNTVQKRMHYANVLVRDQLKTQSMRRNKLYEMNLKEHTFRVNEWVWYHYPRRRVGKSPKWERWYTGPFLIVDQIGPVTYVIQRTKKADPRVVHVDKLKSCSGVTPPSWLTDTTLVENLNLVDDPVSEEITREDSPTVQKKTKSTPVLPMSAQGTDATSNRPKRAIKTPVRFRE